MARFRSCSRWIFCLATLVLVLGAAQVASAHAILVDSTPKANSTVKGTELVVDLRYNVRVDGTRSKLVLVGPSGPATTLVIAKQSSPDHLQSHATGLIPGTYKIQWYVLASDGHMTHGEIPFTVS
jgi:methionine-rich copper-binding protein CopC